MTDEQTLGPVEIAVIEFPGTEFNGDILPIVSDLVDRAIVRILDLVLVSRDPSGDYGFIEVFDLEGDLSNRFAEVDGDVLSLLSDEDISAAAEIVRHGSTAAVVVWENTWARKLTTAIAENGGRLAVHERLDAATVALSMSEVKE